LPKETAIFRKCLLDPEIYVEFGMFSNHHTSPYRQPYSGFRGPGEYAHPQRPPVAENKLKTALVQIERKSFQISLSENDRGRLLRISEDNGNRRNAIIIPATGLAEFHKIIGEMLEASNQLPVADNPPPQ
jgi:hypothetical protein